MGVALEALTNLLSLQLQQRVEWYGKVRMGHAMNFVVDIELGFSLFKYSTQVLT